MPTATSAPTDPLGGDLADLVDREPSGVPCTDGRPPLPGLAPAAVLATVQCIEPQRTEDCLVWGIADGRTILFRVGVEIAREFQAAIDAGVEPTAIVESAQLVAMDLEVP